MALLKEHVAVVTGASSGIGRGIATTFAEHGADVVIADLIDRPKEGGVPTHERIKDRTDARASYVECDVTEPADLEAAMDAAEAYGGVTAMVNNAGVIERDPFPDADEATYDRVMDVNAKGAYFGAQAAAARMLEADRSGSILTVSSINGLFGNGDYPVYCMSKGAVKLLTYALADRLGPHGIRVNAIHPGSVETMLGREPVDSDERADLERGEDALEGVPLGRHGQPTDIANAATFLVSDLAGYVTGESLIVDGGETNT